MEPEHPRPSRLHYPHLDLHSTPVSSPASPQPSAPFRSGSAAAAYMPSPISANMASPGAPGLDSAVTTPGGPSPTPYSHLMHPVRETHTAYVDRDFVTGRKMINEYQVIEEIGRGQHGKVKLAYNPQTNQSVAIKIIPRLSKTRRLGKVSAADPRQNTKREIAILKKIRHKNVVALLEVIDDPELQKIYMVLENVERGEIVWRKKGIPTICYFERYRVEKGERGEELAPGETNWSAVLERTATIRALKEARAKNLPPPVNIWTTKYGVTADDPADQLPWWYVSDPGPSNEAAFRDSPAVSRSASRAPSRVPSSVSVASAQTRLSMDSGPAPLSMVANDGDSGSEVMAASGTYGRGSGGGRAASASAAALDGTMYGAYDEGDTISLHRRSPSIVESAMSEMATVDYTAMVHDPFADDFSYVPCFSIEQARMAFRDTVLGLEYLHYHGVVHRDIKPANLLWTREFHVKISDFGVSYFGRPIRDGEPDTTISEAEALDFDDDRELSKTVGTPAFFAPELCYTDVDKEPPKVSEQIDVWSLGVTLYCLIFARIPFMGKDEFSMYRKIATEDAYISPCRLRPVGAFTDPTGSSLFQRTNTLPYRNDASIEYEPLCDSLRDLIQLMLIKNPEKRIRLRDVKRHPWVTEDIPDVNAWLADTDPARSVDRRIQVDENEIGDAVVPLNFLQRARSAVKRAVDKVMHPRADRDEIHSVPATPRRRSSSSASSVKSVNGDLQSGNSSEWNNSGTGNGRLHSQSLSHNTSYNPIPAGNTSHLHSQSLGYSTNLSMQQLREARRGSLRPDDCFATITQLPSDHPLSQKGDPASPYEAPGESTPISESGPRLTSVGAPSLDRQNSPLETPELPVAASSVDASANAGTSVSAATPTATPSTATPTATPPIACSTPSDRYRPAVRHRHSRSISNAVLNRSHLPRETLTVPTASEIARADTAATLRVATPTRRTREIRAATDTAARTRSVDRAGIVFSNPDKRAGPVVGLNATIAAGSVQQPGLYNRMHTLELRGSPLGISRNVSIAENSRDDSVASDGNSETDSGAVGSVDSMDSADSVESIASAASASAASAASAASLESTGSAGSLDAVDTADGNASNDHARYGYAHISPLQLFSSATIDAYRHGERSSEFSILNGKRISLRLDERPTTAHRTSAITTDCQNIAATSASWEQPQLLPPLEVDPANVQCPPSPRGLTFALEDNRHGHRSDNSFDSAAASGGRSRTMTTATSSSSASFGATSQTPLTSPGDRTANSFVGAYTGGSDSCRERRGSNPMLAFQSDPSLPALLSGASSVSADMEGEFLGSPGVVDSNSLLSGTDSLTPPVPEKDTIAFPLEHGSEPELKDQQEWGSGGAIVPVPVSTTTAKATAAGTTVLAPSSPVFRSVSPVRANRHNRYGSNYDDSNNSNDDYDDDVDDDDGDDSDSDGGIVMAKSKKKPNFSSRDATSVAAHGLGARVQMARRRNTNTSIGSTDTAKKVSMHGEP